MIALDEVSDTTMGGLDFLLGWLETGQLEPRLLAQIVSPGLRLISDQPYKLLKEVAGNWSEMQMRISSFSAKINRHSRQLRDSGSCYRRAVWGHELMLYSGGGWTNEAHMSFSGTYGELFLVRF